VSNEATARLKINQQLEAAGWRLLDSGDLRANVVVEDRISGAAVSGSKSTNGFADYLLLDSSGFPLAVLEAKSSGRDPVVGKEQAATYAKSKNCRFVILSNGETHYFWDLESNAEKLIQKLPSIDYLLQKLKPRKQARLSDVSVGDDWIALSQGPVPKDDLRFLRDYQLDAVKAIAAGFDAGDTRFLLEMATGTGKTLLAAALAKLFLTTGNAKRVLFLVDRIELADQAKQNLASYLSEYNVEIFKSAKDQALQKQVVVATIQSLATNENYLSYFEPTDFDLLISDEAHRSIYGQNRAIFEYFDAARIGLTATPKDYLKNIHQGQPLDEDRELERRILLDTYETFGCTSGVPTFRFDLHDAVNHNPPYLVNPVVFDKRSDKTNQMLSTEGWRDTFLDEQTGESVEKVVKLKQFERTVFSESLNKLMVRELIKSAKRDPITGEIGKSLVYCISQAHASKVTRLLNELADESFPGKYSGFQGTFARQITSNVDGSQELTKKFRNNQLGNTRIGVTVNMMTTGYDCPDLLNVALLRPVFSVADFIQIKGRGTRLNTFKNVLTGQRVEKDSFHLLDFFGVCEYFEERYDYSEPLKLAASSNTEATDPFEASDSEDESPISVVRGNFVYVGTDFLVRDNQIQIGDDCMKIDREAYAQEFERSVRDLIELDPVFKAAVQSGDSEEIERIATEQILEKPRFFFTLDALRRVYESRNGLNDFVRKAAGAIDKLPDRYEKLNALFRSYLVINPNTSYEKSKYFQNIIQCFFTSSDYRMELENGNLSVLDDQTKGGNVPAGKLDRADLDSLLAFIRKSSFPLVN
jgi:type I restriction enzyme R subunit